MFWLGMTAVVLLVFIVFCMVALVGWARLAVNALNSIGELLLEQRRWPAPSTTLRSDFKTDNSKRPN